MGLVHRRSCDHVVCVDCKTAMKKLLAILVIDCGLGDPAMGIGVWLGVSVGAGGAADLYDDHFFVSYYY